MLRIRLDLAYDGTAFAGWAIQPGLRTVQGLLEGALGVVLRAPVRVTVAGRTDSGVHAQGQVAHVDVEEGAWAALAGRSSRTSGDTLVARLGGLLPHDIVVRRAAPAAPGFDARFSALRRRYAYRIADDPARRDPMRRAEVLWHPRALDVDAMHVAARPLVGLQDFAAFSKPRPGATTIRTLEIFDWTRPTEGADAGLVVAVVQADAFCHHMVRALVGASLAVGEHRRPTDFPAVLLAAGVRDPGAGVAHACGLTLEEVSYPDDAELALRAGQTRNRRGRGWSGVELTG
ncbi:tRNA pseudouridine(38-40) synthase TruA [Pengzhenrongella frigida]|uniref:tRNA pseudouridine synthase A n=1 Tax=Pengzhenrongella frigida TaxID=1259133 RepID=A0A4Q5N184_9MICO|nr:tRNA pseudouridine(38-40) synthase TruA [Cellulomonas sp. HLT2-17]RYV51023.1 tRNA pseudouridine(38-40) synthase TruA [Cellulomonas sp. HLT2-17]